METDKEFIQTGKSKDTRIIKGLLCELFTVLLAFAILLCLMGCEVAW